jgi:hypothetical protein
MRPFIRNGDIITVSPLTPGLALSSGKVVAFIHPATGKLVVHRVIGRQGASWRVKADNAWSSDGLVPREHILGYVSKVERRGRLVVLGLGPERYGIAWLSRFLPALPLLLLCWRYPRRLLKKIKGAA